MIGLGGNLRRGIMLASAGSAVALLAGTAHAQAGPQQPTSTEQADQGGVGLADIVVTATKRGNESLQNVPAAISAYSDAEISNFNLDKLNNIDIRTPGLTFTFNLNFLQAYIRGVGSEFPTAGLEMPVAIYTDDLYLQRSLGGQFDMVDIDQIQVLKGPQGTLYGRNATGGAILLTTKNPVDRDEGSLLVETGNLDHQQIDVIFNKPLSDNLALRIAGRYNDQAGYVKNPVSGVDFGRFRNETIRGKLLWKSGNVTALLAGGYSRSVSRLNILQMRTPAPLCASCRINGADIPPGRYLTYQGVNEPFRMNSYYASLRVDADLDDYTLTSISGFRRTTYVGASDQGGIIFAPDGKGLNFLTAGTQLDGKDYSEELRLASRYDGKFNFLLGLNGQYSNEFMSNFRDGLAVGNQMRSAFNYLKTYTWSAFADVYYDLTDTIKLTAGGRYSYDRKKMHARTGGSLAGNPPFAYDDSWKQFTPHAIVQFTPDEGQNYYFSYSVGFKSGGFSLVTYAPAPTDTLRPEKLKSFEIGAKNSFLSNRVRTSVAAFYYDYSDIQVSKQDTAGIIRQNAGKARIYGFELDAMAALTRGLTAGFGYAYLHTRFTEFPNVPIYVPTDTGFVTSNIVDGSGLRLPRAPKHTITGSLSYDFPVSDDWGGTLTIVGRYNSSYDFDPAAGGPLRLDRQKGFALVNMTGSLGPQDGGYKVGFFINNLFDKYYRTTASTNTLGGYDGAAPPRTYGVNMTLSY